MSIRRTTAVKRGIWNHEAHGHIYGKGLDRKRRTEFIADKRAKSVLGRTKVNLPARWESRE